MNQKCSILLEYVEGGALFDWLHKRKFKNDIENTQSWVKDSLNWVEKWELMKQMVVSVNYLHTGKKIQVLHRDVKSANFLISKDMTHLKLADFGMSKLRLGEEAILKTTETNISTIGTMRWKSPESMMGSSDTSSLQYTDKSDIWSLGLTIYELITERIPYDKIQEEIRVCFTIKDGHKPDIKNDKLGNIPKIFSQIIQQCISTNPDDRPCSLDLLKYIEKNERTFLEKYKDIDEKMSENIEKAKLLKELMEIGKSSMMKRELDVLNTFMIENYTDIENPKYFVNHLYNLMKDKNFVFFNELADEIKYEVLKCMARYLDLTLIKQVKRKSLFDESFQKDIVKLMEKLETLTTTTQMKYEVQCIKESVKNMKTNENAFSTILSSFSLINSSDGGVSSLMKKLFTEISKNPKKWYIQLLLIRIQSYKIINGLSFKEESTSRRVENLFKKLKISKNPNLNYGMVTILNDLIKYCTIDAVKKLSWERLNLFLACESIKDIVKKILDDSKIV